jgi:hypothetical protein
VCTHETVRLDICGSGKGPEGWMTLADASVYYDHPHHLELDHALNIDMFSRTAGTPARIAVELDPGSARMLAHAILAAVDASSEQ